MAAMGALGCGIHLQIAFRGLRSRDVMTKSDPFAKVTIQEGKNGKVSELGSTRALKNVSDGSWPDSINAHFKFEESQIVTVHVFDYDEHTNHDLIGRASFTLGNLMGSRGQCISMQLESHGHSGSRGSITVVGEKLQGGGSDSVLALELCASGVEAKDWGGLSRSDPYFIIERQVGEQWISVYQSEWIKSTKSPHWRPMQISLGKLCQGNMNQPLRISVFDYDEGSSPDLIGEFHASAQDLIMAAGGRRRFDIKHPPTTRKYQKASYLNSGLMEVVSAVVQASPTSRMLDYLAGGLHVNLILAVDFTASNGDPSSPRSLHYSSGAALNEYQSAIASVGSILQPYDSDGMIAAFGFGGVFRGTTSHCFPLNGSDANPEVHGVQGVMHAYSQALANVPLSGPTYFAPLLAQVNRIVFNPELSQQAQTYTVLLILTDGAIMDMQATVDEIVRSSEMPLSIVIVGIGSADMSSMEYLDADGKALKSSNGLKAIRDTVQFVCYKDCKCDGELLARRTLGEVPTQLVQFFDAKGIKPNAPLAPPGGAVPVAMAASGPPAPPHGVAQGRADAVPLATQGKAVLAQAFAL